MLLLPAPVIPFNHEYTNLQPSPYDLAPQTETMTLQERPTSSLSTASISHASSLPLAICSYCFRYTGSTVCFEAINAILGYNDQLIDIWRKQLDDEVFDAARKGGEASVDTRAKDHAVEVIEEKM